MQTKKNSYGQITALADSYQISRAFLYQLLAQLKIIIPFIFSPQEQEKQISKKEIISKILLLMLPQQNKPQNKSF